MIVIALFRTLRPDDVLVVVAEGEAREAVRQDIIAQTVNAAVDLLACDLSSQASIRSFAAEFTRRYTRLNVLINKAANFDLRLKQATLTADGVEVVLRRIILARFC